jgi:hypothetical protein
MAAPHQDPDAAKLQDVQDKIDRAPDRARAHGIVSDSDGQRGTERRKRDERHAEEEEAIDGLRRPGLG